MAYYKNDSSFTTQQENKSPYLSERPDIVRSQGIIDPFRMCSQFKTVKSPSCIFYRIWSMSMCCLRYQGENMRPTCMPLNLTRRTITERDLWGVNNSQKNLAILYFRLLIWVKCMNIQISILLMHLDTLHVFKTFPKVLPRHLAWSLNNSWLFLLQSNFFCVTHIF